MLDGPLAWAAWQEAQRLGLDCPPATPDYCHDFDLPLARWQQAGTWGWCTSQATVDVVSHSGTELRRRPPTAQMARYTTAAKHHAALGPYKARDTIITTEWVTTATWCVLATDQSRLETLLAQVTHLGTHRAIGHGHIASWRIEPGTDLDAWRDRPMPTPDIAAAHRAPYWHPSRRITIPAQDAS